MPNKLILENLVGSHILQGIEVGTRLGNDFWNKDEECNYIKFTLDGITYIVLENPDDGYRSYAEDLEIVDEVCNIKLPNIQVLCRMREGSKYSYRHEENDVLEFIDVINEQLILAVGTGNINDYYPYCVLDYYPENMSCNRRAENG